MSPATWLALKAPWQWGNGPGSRWLARLLRLLPALGLLALIVALSLAGEGPRLFAVILGLLLIGVGVLVLWGHQFNALLRLDHPHSARLVPGHRSALRRTAVLTWLALVAACSAVTTAVAVSFGAEASLAWRTALLTGLCSGAALVFVAMALRWWLLWVLVWLWPLAGAIPLLGATMRAMREAASVPWQAAPAWCTALGLALGAGVLVSVFGRGDAAHAHGYARRERTRLAFEPAAAGRATTVPAAGLLAQRLGWPLQRLADAWLGRLLAQARPTRSSVMARADIVLHGPQHWLRLSATMLPLLLLLALIGTGVALGPDTPARTLLGPAAFGSAIGLTCMLVGIATGWPGALWTSRREQALVVLLPGMPQGTVLNQVLARRHARTYLLMWATLLPLFGAIAWATGAWHTLTMPAVALSMVAWLWRDMARLRSPSPAGAAWPFFVCLLLGTGSAWLLREQPGWTVPWLVTWAIVSAAVAGWRWRRLAQWPQALPAGRLS